MSTEILFHSIFVASFLVFTAIRMVYHRRAARVAGRVSFKEGRLHSAMRALFGIPFMLLVFGYMAYPSILSWAVYSLPDWARWIGAVLVVASLPLVYWVQWALGDNFSTRLHVREAHTLVTHGPYRWVRPPMYSVFYMQSIGFCLLTANWFIGGIYFLGLTVIVLTRTHNEEAAMLEKFGDDYRRYMAGTGRFLPKIR